MGTNYSLITDVLKLVEMNPAVKIIDIGSGFGQYGFLIRQYFEDHPQDPSKWKITLDSIEIFQEYTSLTSVFYNTQVFGDITDFPIQGYDLVLFTNVIEHLPKERGIKLLQRLLSDNRMVLVTTPFGFRANGPKHGNRYNIHLSGWSPKDFKKLGMKVQRRCSQLIATQNMTHLPFRKKIPYRLRYLLLRVLNLKRSKTSIVDPQISQSFEKS